VRPERRRKYPAARPAWPPPTTTTSYSPGSGVSTADGSRASGRGRGGPAARAPTASSGGTGRSAPGHAAGRRTARPRLRRRLDQRRSPFFDMTIPPRGRQTPGPRPGRVRVRPHPRPQVGPLPRGEVPGQRVRGHPVGAQPAAQHGTGNLPGPEEDLAEAAARPGEHPGHEPLVPLPVSDQGLGSAGGGEQAAVDRGDRPERAGGNPRVDGELVPGPPGGGQQ